MKHALFPISRARDLPLWRRPESLLFLMAFAMPVAFNTWSALLNNFVIEAAGFTGVEIGWLHTVREIPGFLAVGVIALLMFMREQVLGLVALLLLGAATAVTAFFPRSGACWLSRCSRRSGSTITRRSTSRCSYSGCPKSVLRL